ncbi:GumN family protein [Oleispira antarctica RB-8]|uniref:GumN family protein n=1 Tax=Oleispira antarctica RB-8 TaxID=698738 RepID=R4YQL5_OLEAN|nr:GumN family protein [Oleispira antarctica RB-8]
MNLIRLPLLISIQFILTLLLSVQSQAQTSVWQVSNGDNTIYLGGTFHMLMPQDYPLPKEFEQVYKKVNWLVFETDIAELDTPDFQKKFLKAMSLPNGQILADQLSPQAYSGLIHYAAKNNIDTGRLQHFKPQMIALIVTLEELKKYGLTAQGVDSFMGDKASLDGKMVTKLESIDEQINYIATMSEGYESELILQTLEDIQVLSRDLTIMRDAWRSGNSHDLFETGISPMKKDYPQIYHSLLVERNNNWLPKIERLIKQPESKFILVGALHLIGEDGLLEQLKRRGYQVQQYNSTP